MADDTNSNGAEVTLGADTSPFEQALDRAAEYAKGWGSRVSAVVDALNAFTETKARGWADATEAIAGATSNQIGQTVGQGLGAAVGVWFGGPAGAAVGQAVGRDLGAVVGNSFDLTPLAGASADAMAAVQPVVDRITDTWDVVQNDAADTFAVIKESLLSITADDLFGALVRDDAAAQEKIKAAWDNTLQEIEGFGARQLSRLREGVDAVWAGIQEPVAVFAGYIQEIGVQLGLVEAGTASWADAIRGVKDVGNELLYGLGYGLGYLEGLLKKFAGYVGEYLLDPLTQGVTVALTLMADAARAAAEAVGDNFVGRELAAGADALDRASQKVKDAQGGMLKQFKELQDTDADALGHLTGKGFQLLADKGDESRATDRPDRRTEKPPEPPAREPEALASIRALAEGSSEANNAILRAAGFGGGSGSPQERTAKAGEDTANQVKGVRTELKDLNKKFDRIQSLGVI